MAYDHRLDTNYLRTIARMDYVGARILWNIGVFMPSLHLLHESIEKYLKVLWLQKQTFATDAEYEAALKKLGHDFNKIYGALDASDRARLDAVLQKYGLMLYKLEGLRYGTRQSGIGYGDGLFRSAELFIREIRLMVGEKVPNNLFSELFEATSMSDWMKMGEKARVIKGILQLKRHGQTKKQRKSLWREFRTMLSHWDGNPPQKVRDHYSRKAKRSSANKF